jgi:hypothetical protein
MATGGGCTTGGGADAVDPPPHADRSAQISRSEKDLQKLMGITATRKKELA